MDLSASLAIADGGLLTTTSALAVIGQNVANAGSADWSAEVATQESIAASGIGMGVRTLPTQRQLDAQLQGSVFAQNAAVAGYQTQQTALSAIDQVQGTVGAGTDLASLLGALQDAFSTLEGDPSNQTQQQAVVAAAGNLAGQINALSDAVGQTRQNAQNSAVAEVAQANTTLAQIGSLNAQIVALQQQGQSTADLQNQRDAAVDQLNQILPVKQVAQADGSVLLITAGGLTLPTQPGAPQLGLAAATLGPNVTYPADPAVPAVTLGGLDVTAQLGSGGSLGANIALRDSTLPAMQAGLDEFSETLATRFDQQGLTLFTNAAGSVPSATGPYTQSGYVGFASEITVNPAVAAQPSLVRDGTHAVAGSTTGASAFTPNPPGGPVGFTGMIDRVLDYALGGDVQAGVPQPAPAGTGLGPGGDLNAGFTPPADLAGFATALAGSMSQTVNDAGTALASAQALQTGLQARLSASDGVSIDSEMTTMIQLQNAYGAVLSADRQHAVAHPHDLPDHRMTPKPVFTRR